MDTVDPSRVRSMGGKWYVLVIVDDYSHYSWVFFLERKDEVFEYFQSLALRLNNEHPSCLKDIHSDNETEFRTTSFDEFCLGHDICDILTQCLIGLIEYLYHQCIPSFPKVHLQRTLRLSVLDPEQF
jgi:hypothetical protein